MVPFSGLLTHGGVHIRLQLIQDWRSSTYNAGRSVLAQVDWIMSSQCFDSISAIQFLFKALFLPVLTF